MIRHYSRENTTALGKLVDELIESLPVDIRPPGKDIQQGPPFGTGRYRELVELLAHPETGYGEQGIYPNSLRIFPSGDGAGAPGYHFLSGIYEAVYGLNKTNPALTRDQLQKLKQIGGVPISRRPSTYEIPGNLRMLEEIER